MVCDMWYFEREIREEFRNNIKIMPDCAKHVVVEIWFNPLQINLGLKQLFCCSHRQPIYNQRSSTLTLNEQDHNSHLGMHGILCGILMLSMFLWDTNSLRDNLQTARGPGKCSIDDHRQASFVPLYLFNWFVQHKFLGHIWLLSEKRTYFLRSTHPLVGTFVFYPLAITGLQGVCTRSSRREHPPSLPGRIPYRGSGSPSSRLETSSLGA